jgi:hypothetical protein
MRGQTFLSYALAALATTAYAAPLAIRNEDRLEGRDAYAFSGKVGTVNVGKEYVQRRQDEPDEPDDESISGADAAAEA